MVNSCPFEPKAGYVDARAEYLHHFHGVQSEKDGEALEAEVKVLTQELSTLTVSAVKRVEFRDAIANLSKKVAACKKQKIAGMTDEIVSQMVAAAEATEGNKVVVT